MSVINFNELLDASRLTQTQGAPGRGTPLLFRGPPGTTKTAQLKSYSDLINHHCEVIILGRIPSVDIGGIYAPDFEKGELRHMITHRLLGEIEAAEGKDGICIFFDEVGNTSEEQQTSLQSLIEDRCLEGHKIPDNVWFVFATNPTTSNSGSNDIVRSLLDRLCIVDIKDEDIRETLWPGWKAWAEGLNNPHEIHPTIVTYNTWKEGESIYKFDAYSEEKSPTFRSWTKLSGFLEQGTSEESLKVLGPGCIGTATWADFNGYRRLGENLPDLIDIETNPETAKIPDTDDCPSATYAVICNIATGLKIRRKRKEEIEKGLVEAIITYLRRLPDTFAVYGFKMARVANPDFTEKTPMWGKFRADHRDMRL